MPLKYFQLDDEALLRNLCTFKASFDTDGTNLPSSNLSLQSSHGQVFARGSKCNLLQLLIT